MLRIRSQHRATRPDRPTFALRLLGSIGLAVTVLAIAPFAYAGQTDPITVELPPEDQGAAFVPGFRTLSDLPEEYIEEEFFIRGSADLYNYAQNPPLGPTDTTTIQTDVDYRTRVIVRRPAKSNKFNGNVVIEWWNTTAGFDTAPVWDPSAEFFAREGYIYVGLTNSNQGMSYLLGGCRLLNVLPPSCGTRYATLSLPDDGLIWDIASQLANHMRIDDTGSIIPSEYEVERIYHSGQSQQGGSIITYASGFHMPGINDGYFVQANIGARRINGGPICGSEGAPPYSGCTPLLQGADRLVRTDLPVPVVQGVTETDLVVLFGPGGRQPDAQNYRYYEMAGTAHLTIHENVEVLPAGFLGSEDPLFLEDLCQFPLNTTADGPVYGSYLYNAMWHNMDQQVQRGTAPPPGLVIDLDEGGLIARDPFGNALGGVRVPEMDVPTGSHNPPTNQADPALPGFLRQIGNLACFLGGSTFAFDSSQMHAIYSNRGGYINQVARAANDLRRAGYLLQADRQLIMQRAHEKWRFGCGLGFEVALVVPLVMAARRARRRS
jgi:hypothetical protein